MDWKAYKTNIKIAPVSMNKIIGDTRKFRLYGTVLDVGSEVKDIQVGDMVVFVKWGMTEIEMADGTKDYFLEDKPYFILAVIKKDEIKA